MIKNDGGYHQANYIAKMESIATRKTYFRNLLCGTEQFAPLFALRKHCKPGGKQQVHSNLLLQGFAKATIGRHLLIQRKCRQRRIFHRPELTPTGTGNDWSGIGRTIAQDNPLIPAHLECWLDQAISGNGRNALLLQHLL